MFHELLPSAWYHVRSASDTPELRKIAEALPHGSGLDDNWWITVRKDKGLTLRTTWHTMNDHGYYVGYFPLTIVVKRDDEGKWEVKSLRINERKTNHAGDYVADVVREALRKMADCCYPDPGQTSEHHPTCLRASAL